MLWILLKHQFRALYASLSVGRRKNGVATPRSLSSTILILSLFGFAGIYFAFLFYGIFYMLHSGVRETEYPWLGFAVMGMLVFLIDFVMTIFTAKSQLFEASDNELLLSMPIRPRDILLARMLTILFTDFVFELLIAIPCYIAWIVAGGFSFGGLACFLLTLAAMPLLALSLSCLVGWILSLISAHMKNSNLINTILSFGFLAVYMALCMGMQSYSTLLLTNAAAIAPVIKKWFYPFYCLGDAVVNENFLSALIYIAVMVVPFVFTCYILARSFIALVTKKQGAARGAYREDKTQVRPLMFSLITRELRRLLSSTTYLVNAGLGVVFLPIFGIGSFFLKDGITTLADNMGVAAEELAPAVAIAALSMIGSMISFTASSISLEGNTIYDLKALPVEGHAFLLSKLYTHLLVALPFTLLSSILCIIALPCNFVMGVLLLAVPPVVHTLFALVGLLMNMAFPRFDWESETAVVKQSLSMTLTMLINLFAGIIITGLGTAAIIFLPALPAWTIVLLIGALSAILSAVIILFIRKRGNAVFGNFG